MARGARQFRNMRGFAGHRSGGGSKFLSKWKENGNSANQKGCTGSIETWMHRKTLPLATYRHSLPMVTLVKDKDDKSKQVKRVFTKTFVCHETETTLEGQYFRDRDTGERKMPIERCGLCKLVEWCYQQAVLYEETRESKKPKGLSFVTPIFRFTSDDEPNDNMTLHIGGIANLFGKDLTDAQKLDLKEAKIRVGGDGGAWRENAWARCQYGLYVVDNANPDSGVQLAVEAGSLGDEIKRVLTDELENEVDIQKTPYCIRWEYYKKETDLKKKYKARALRKLVPTPRIMKLISGDAPVYPTDLTEPFNQQTMRATLERHCILPKGVVPWDELFPTKEQSAQWAKEDAEEEDEEEEETEEEEDEPSTGVRKKTAKANRTDEDGDDESEDEDDDEESDGDDDEDEEDDDGDEEEFACDNDKCDAVVKASDTECPKCGTKFNVVDEEKEEPEPEEKKPPMRSRSEAMAAKKGGGGGGGSSKKNSTSISSPEENGDSDDDVPFIRDTAMFGVRRV